MSDSVGRYHFLAWARRGIAASITDLDDGGPLPARASLNVQVSVSVQQGGSTSVVLPKPRVVEMFGPGDIKGLILQHVIRTEPRNSTPNFEPNYLAGIEFDAPDFPWLFTPAAAKNDRLRPWMALIALKPDEFTQVKTAPNPLPSIQVTKASALQNLADSWNWAHVQVSGDTPLANAMATEPGSVISRLFCPRRLDPETSYTAFLVPAFEIGRKKGLGEDVSGIVTADPAWTGRIPVPLTLPVYYQFEFHTSDAGDFESLVRRLTPRVLPAEVGQRPMDVTQPANHIPSAGPPLGLEGALHSVSTVPTPWNDPDKTAFQTAVQTFINQPSTMNDDPAHPNADDPVVAAPIYGRWPARVQAVDRTEPGWINDLNLDPRNRVASGTGTQVVQVERTHLMASAWQQVEGVLKANQMLRQAQLARAATQQIYRQHLNIAAPETALTLTAPLHARIMASPITVRATVRGSRVPERMLSPAFRRVTRPRRRIGPAPQQRVALLTRVNSGEIDIVPPPKPPDGLVSIEQISDRLHKRPHRHHHDWDDWWEWLFEWWERFFEWLEHKGYQQLTVAGFTPKAVAAVPPSPNFQIVPEGTMPAVGRATGPDSAAASAFRAATTDLFATVQALPVDPPQAPALNLLPIKNTLMARLDPVFTVPRRVLSLLSFSSRLQWLFPDPLEPIMAAPKFPQPMYVPLRDLSPQYVLPGVELIPPDTLGLLVANHAFIEAYMVGLNHEMARQLLWNDYPTDQMGSPFRQFWDVSAYVPTAKDPTDPAKLHEMLKDIPPVNTWPNPVPLGDHPNRTDIVLNNVVLLVRGEIFKRYPTAIVYAGKAKKQGATRVLDETDERYPIFRGTLPNDITFLGFNLSVEDARGGTVASPEGFFFVFQQQPSEPRFGLEPMEQKNPTTLWADLAWTNFGGGGDGAGGGGIFQLPDFGATTRAMTIKESPWRLASQVFSLVVNNTSVPDFLLPGVQPDRIAIAGDQDNPDDTKNKWGVNAAQTAYILLRAPFRVLIHADFMLP